jgi:ubiquinone/menaquinone biosynthesis C-methylase UbiE
MTEITNWSYERHRGFESQLTDIPSVYSSPHTVDAWRHRRMLETALPLLEAYPGATWLTIGDGRYGSDAHFLMRHGADVTASSLTNVSLRVAQERGWIGEYRAENAESLSLADQSVDFVFCKESFHHFPRPYIALYEMLRVARIGVVLIEPQEETPKMLDVLKQVVKRVTRGDKSFLFERVGNYIFRLNVRELERIQTAMYAPMLAYKHFNDFFQPRLARATFEPRSRQARFMQLGIFVQDVLCGIRLMNYGLASAICFKQPASAAAIEKLRRGGFHIVEMPKNPYV